ncbi:AvrD family protein [Curtobacterium sp. NPDC089689]|uniref:AvrD family protein n=1 Tax=Curtobacterium sp. NPDC089689 TaxID=3363968 RepID=UPI0037FDAE53
MSMLSSPKPEAAASDVGFDAHLGAAHGRFLGDGHRRVRLELMDLVATDDATAEGVARVAYPRDWSLKAGVAREAHLSTADAIRVAGAVRSALVASPMTWLGEYGYERSLGVRAGARPFTELDAVPVRTRVDRTGPDTVRLSHSVGSLKVESEWTRSKPPTFADDGWRAGNATGVRLLTDSRVSCTYERKSSTLSSVSFLEVMMLTAQMSQVALYQGDADRRAQSGNMWMRRAGFLRHTPTPQRLAGVDLNVVNRRELIVGGRTVQTADVVAEDVFGVQVTASLATGTS